MRHNRTAAVILGVSVFGVLTWLRLRNTTGKGTVAAKQQQPGPPPPSASSSLPTLLVFTITDPKGPLQTQWNSNMESFAALYDLYNLCAFLYDVYYRGNRNTTLKNIREKRQRQLFLQNFVSDPHHEWRRLINVPDSMLQKDRKLIPSLENMFIRDDFQSAQSELRKIHSDLENRRARLLRIKNDLNRENEFSDLDKLIVPNMPALIR